MAANKPTSLLFCGSRRRCFVIIVFVVALTVAMVHRKLLFSALSPFLPMTEETRSSEAQESSNRGSNSSSSSLREAQLSFNAVIHKDLAKTKPLCPAKPPIEQNAVALNLTEVTYMELAEKYADVIQHGGHYSPRECTALERLALIIPYRARERNLHILLNNLIPFLIRQQADFTIFLVQQTEDYPFNRCLMFNVGFVESQKLGTFTCFLLHDTDLIPTDNRNLYRCHQQPRHLVLLRANRHWKERLPYPTFLGGAVALRKKHMEKTNGCSNSYYGWGLEDDDLMLRLITRGFRVERYSVEIGSYYSMDHPQQPDNTDRGKLVQTIFQRMNRDGLNTLTYTLVQQEERQIYTWLLVKPPPPPIL